ncbi:MAG: tetratricopeptide repeat protein [SAR202 cluster bacterium]|nr:tetratricopeptide repeat protein [SAR202 cluster bacterium]
MNRLFTLKMDHCSRYLAEFVFVSMILLLAACSDVPGDTGTGELETGATTEVGRFIEPRSTVKSKQIIQPNPTATSLANIEKTPVSETESVSFYINAFNLMGRGEYVDAERTFTTVTELEPRFARGWDGRGQSLMLQGKFQEAMLDFDRAIELKPNLAIAYANRAMARVGLEDVDGAFRDATRAVELDEESVAGLLVLGRVHATRGDADKALEWFDLAVATGSDDGSTWWWRGRFFRDVLRIGHLALDDFNKAIELAPAQAALYIDRALLYIQAEAEKELARADLEEAISLAQDPKLPSIIERADELLAILDQREADARIPK